MPQQFEEALHSQLTNDRDPTPISAAAEPKVRVVEPPLEAHPHLRQKLTDGEQLVFNLFNQYLAPEWEIYVQPHLNGLRPDFVLLNPNVGIAVFEVKDWNLDAMLRFPKRVNDTRVELWGQKDGKEFSVERENPFTTIARYKERIFNLYCPRLQQKAGFAAITGGVIFPFADADRVRRLQAAFLNENEKETAGTYLPISGREDIANGNLAATFPHSTFTRSKFMRPDLADDLRSWLVEPDFATEQRKPLTLDSRQKDLAETRTKSGYRRIKGPAGSGKSLVLAAKASHLISEGKSVLIVTFNITLWHYLRDMVVRNVKQRGRMENIVFAHFHEWCKDVCLEADLGASYDELFVGVRRIEALDLQPNEKAKRISEMLEPIMDTELPELAARAAASPSVSRYDAILVDEGQDFLPPWWNALRNCLNENGEMLLVADSTQDVYGKARSWTDAAMSGAGFSGDWARLEVSYRLPPEAQQVAQDFARKFLPKDMIDLPEVAQSSLPGVEPCTLRWMQCSPEDAQKQCVDEILAMMRQAGGAGLANTDITFICNDIDFGQEVTGALDTYGGIYTVHTFERDRREQTRRKMSFFMGDARIKATTLHSFKGWESRLLVIRIGHAVGQTGLASIYAALTRLKRSPKGSWLTVVCSAQKLAEYGKTWPDYREKQTAPEENPYLRKFAWDPRS
ncbi:nuclease-related domain-containing protein [Mesorhizobium sp.]|uniref:nuclease-related domain-containing DEAD/DEAH box helicase n=1 Tax=Mesorhizobium sp. TaxID=1871066 RepID=UPI000FE8C962|nr:nuclease-related domain-containing protein [Mesorhizobium sp.]RWQ62278.1 MAG: DNA helicase [Mesorhizobium sp.]